MTPLLILLVVTNGIWLLLYLDLWGTYRSALNGWKLACDNYDELIQAAREAVKDKEAT